MSYHTRNLYMKPTTIKTDSVILRNFTDADGHNIKELDSDPEVMRYLTDGEPSSEEIVQKTMDVFLGFVDKTQGKYGFWAAEDIKTKEFIGWFQLRPLKEDPDNYKVLELGYRLKKKFWGIETKSPYVSSHICSKFRSKNVKQQKIAVLQRF